MQPDYEDYRAQQLQDGQAFQDFVVDLAWPLPFPRRPRSARLRLRTTPRIAQGARCCVSALDRLKGLGRVLQRKGCRVSHRGECCVILRSELDAAAGRMLAPDPCGERDNLRARAKADMTSETSQHFQYWTLWRHIPQMELNIRRAIT